MKPLKRAIWVWSSNAALAVMLGGAIVRADSTAVQNEKAAGPSVLSAKADASGDEVALGARFESTSAGISFCPPASCRLVSRISSNYVAEWADPQRNWTLTLARMALDKPRPLTAGRDNFGKEVSGLLDDTVSRLKNRLPGAKVLRQDLTNIAQGGAFDPHHPELEKPNVGLIALRYTQGAKRYLSQQALIQASDRLYYLLTLTSPGSEAREENASDDPGERAAVETFSMMLDSVHLLDRVAIKRDQDERLYRTRTFLVNLKANKSKLQDTLIKQQWLRYIRDGKDIGYSYITEETAAGVPRPLTKQEVAAGKSELDIIKPGNGVLIGMRSRMISQGVRPDKSKGDVQTDSACWFFTSPDFKHEEWSRLIVVDDHVSPEKQLMQEIGSSDKRIAHKVHHPPDQGGGALGAAGGGAEPWVELKDEYDLTVNLRTNHETPEPISRQLPPWYLPEAAGELLPRLLDLNHPKTYLFATYVNDVREVMNRYVDVKEEQKVTFAGQTMRAVPIEDRLGLDGSITIHYVSPEGVYLGSENKDQKLTVLPSDAATLMNIWKNANLSKPGGVEPQQKGPQVPQRAELNPSGSDELRK